MIVKTAQGRVRGTVERGVARFLGVPYAAAPYGADRFAPPRPHDPWAGVREARSMGPTPPQVPYAGGLEKVLPSVIIHGEEVLNLNVWAPAEGTGHPVMVWVPGGALTRGGNALATYEGSAFARDGVVLVSINYRLGAEGFSVLDDAPANLGLADQFAALRWVRDNIAAFGGDPGRVTVAGQSAGGGAVAALLAHPSAGELFAQAVVQSGPLAPGRAGKARRITRLMAKELGVRATREAFARVPPEELLACQTRVLAKGVGFGVVPGDELVPSDPGTALLAGAGAGIPLMMGHTAEEFRLWTVPTGKIDKIGRLHVLAARVRFRDFAARRGASSGDVFGALVTDALLRRPMNTLADARRGRTWMYEFAWRSPVMDLGAAHATELAYVFDTLDSSDAEMIGGPGRPRELADRMHAAWVRFVKDGDPGWPAWDEGRPVMVFDSPGGGVVRTSGSP
ncbi:carboxylesterase/lipase family protein [Nonomuraea dietziae]|uniref:Carboxylic ester hydrolase n=1 Tax=Nonomuraea dietziae TaxID=65515 RepID=A0A7W5VJP8_9ACTN|nr:carboxylesterase family protein [Nonomuraea dietziae]MBB3729122.1 para-nitrobenzyl esterase [Nonomuraea dietziae]